MSTWMVVEDEPDLYDTLLALFEIWSIDGVAFTNGTDAIKWVDDVDKGNVDTNLPELALLDIRLPGATGPEIGKRLRQSPALKDMTIVLITSYHLTLEQEQEVIRIAGADTLIYKPLPSPADFRARLQRTINERARAAAEAKAAPAAKPEEAPKAAEPPAPPARPAPAPPKPAAPGPSSKTAEPPKTKPLPKTAPPLTSQKPAPKPAQAAPTQSAPKPPEPPKQAAPTLPAKAPEKAPEQAPDKGQPRGPDEPQK